MQANERRVAAEHAAAADRAAAQAAADHEAGLRLAAADAVAALDKAEARWRLEREALQFNLDNLSGAHEALKSRVDFERERFFSINGDLQSRHDAVAEEYETYKRTTDEAMSKFSGLASSGTANAMSAGHIVPFAFTRVSSRLST